MKDCSPSPGDSNRTTAERKRTASPQQDEEQFKVFLGWSGNRSKELARLIHERLGNAFFTAVRPWTSEIDTAAGATWPLDLWENLQDAGFGIICLTRENKDDLWLHFEAGVIAKAVPNRDNRVCPLLLDMSPSDLTGSPLAALKQATSFDEAGMKKLAQALNDALPSSKHNKDIVNANFETHWPILRDKASKIPKQKESRNRKLLTICFASYFREWALLTRTT